MRLASLLLAAAPLQDAPVESTPSWDPTPHLLRVAELYHLTDTFGDDLWPGFDTREIPIVVNDQDQHELLINHPDPPAEYARWQGAAPEGMAVFVREGCSRFGPKGGGWGVDLGGAYCAYVSELQEGQELEAYLSLLLHECFHVYQRGFQAPGEGPYDELPELDAAYAAGIGLESRVLAAALADGLTDAARRELAALVVAVRERRRAGRSAGLVRMEAREEYNEGTATYSQARLMELIRDEGGLPARAEGGVGGYREFTGADRRYRELVGNLPFAETRRITFFDAQYHSGMALGLLLDRVRPGWKEELTAAGECPYSALHREFPLTAEQVESLAAVADARFDGAALLAAQTTLVDAQRAHLEALLEPAGRRFVVYHGELPGTFKWKPRGPVDRVPEDMTPERLLRPFGSTNRVGGRGATIWEGGFETFEKAGLTVTTGTSPVVFGTVCFEWTDADPAAELADVTVESDAQDGDVHTNLHLVTDGFELRAARARLILEEERVVVVPESGR